MELPRQENKAAYVRELFGRIAHRYDLVNTLMTLGSDRRWRRLTAKLVGPEGAIALDIASGTGELALELARQGARQVVGVDFCEPMVKDALHKIRQQVEAARVSLVVGDALCLPFPDNTFDCAVNAFLLRNLTNLKDGLREFLRVLKPGGRLASLDLTQPRAPLLQHALAFYMSTVVPMLGASFAGDLPAYRYLGASLAVHPDADAVVAMMREVGFARANYVRLGLGAVAIHLGFKEHSAGA